MGGLLIRAGDLEVVEIRNGGKGADEGGDVRGGVEKRWILFHKQVSHLPAAIGRSTKSGERAALRLDIWLVGEGYLFACYTVEKRREEGVWAVRHSEGEVTNMMAYPVESGHTSGFGEGAWAEGDGEVVEKEWCSADPEIMAGEAKRAEVFLGKVGEEVVAGLIRPPELEKGGAGRHYD